MRVHGDFTDPVFNGEDGRILTRVAALPQMPMSELAVLWKELFQRDAPKYNKPYLVKRIAYRLQEITHNVDSETIDARLEAYARDSLSDNLKRLIRFFGG
jgi:hypothetical protein